MSSSGFSRGSNGKQSACNAGDLGSIPREEDPLEKGMATHFSILAWRIPWTECLTQCLMERRKVTFDDLITCQVHEPISCFQEPYEFGVTMFILQMMRITNGFPTVFRIPPCKASLAPVGLAEAPVLLCCISRDSWET